jgi:hypothetical protein
MATGAQVLRVPRTSPARRCAGFENIAACIAVDWSGSMSEVRSRLWLAESRGGRLVRIECGRDRADVVRHLIECARREPRLVIGLDFAFSFPRWFVDELSARSAREVWEAVAREGEGWLERCPPPFWGKPCMPRPPRVEGRSDWRATEGSSLPVGGIWPKSVFQIGGAGSVGTGSLRGMPFLCELQDAGISVWPFDPARLPMVVEIYPRYLTGKVNKSSAVARSLYLQSRYAREFGALLDRAASSEDAFDAAVSAACMQRFSRDFGRIARGRRTGLDLTEGRIWSPLRDPLFERW